MYVSTQPCSALCERVCECTHFFVIPNRLDVPRKVQIIHNVTSRSRIHDQIVGFWMHLVRVHSVHKSIRSFRIWIKLHHYHVTSQSGDTHWMLLQSTTMSVIASDHRRWQRRDTVDAFPLIAVCWCSSALWVGGLKCVGIAPISP